MISKKFIQSSLLYTVAGMLPTAAGFLLLPLYIYFLRSDLIGELAIYQAITLFFQIFSSLGIENAITYYFFEARDNPVLRKKYLSSINVSSLLISGFFLLVFLFSSLLIPEFKIDTLNINLYPFIFLCFLTGVFTSFNKILNILLINEQKPVTYFLVNTVTFLLLIIVTLLLFYFFPESLIAPVWGRAIASLIVFSFALFYLIKQFGFTYDAAVFKTSVKYSFPYFFNMVLLWSMSYMDRFILGKFMNLKDVAVYDVIVKFSLLIELFLNGLINAINPKVFRIWRENDKMESTQEANKYFNVYTLISLVLIAVSILTFPAMISVLIPKEPYLSAIVLFPLLAVGYASKNLLHMYAAPFLVYRKNGNLPFIYVTTAVLQMIITVFFVINFGILGAVIAQLISRQILIFLFALECNRFFKFNFNKWKILYLPFCYFIIVVAGELVKSQISSYLVYSLELFLLLILIYFVYKNEIPVYIQFFRKKIFRN
jgi:O-antigen/teichoic acid export membrane protein